jgi:signal transduction histidine kinase
METERTQAAPARILLFEESQDFSISAVAALCKAVPTAEVVTALSMQKYTEALSRGEFDIVVVDYDMPMAQSVDFLPRLRLRDYEPDVLLISRCEEISTVRLIAEARSRYIVRDERCLDTLAHSVRDMLRIRRLELENSSIRARLSEANGMLDEKNRRLDEFCATIAHDIRGPLAGLILKIDYILDAYEEKFDERCSGLLKRSLDSAQRLVGVVQAMYEFAKVGSKASKMELVDLKQLAAEVIADLNVDESKDVHVGLDELPTVWGNPGLLRRVFINLINNAIKYNDKSEIKINIGYEGDIQRSTARYARIFVEDNGPGIPADETSGVFAMFSRGKSGGVHTSDGLGIGLAVVQKIVELHFGRVEVDSQIGEGCRFSFSLPREKVEVLG